MRSRSPPASVLKYFGVGSWLPLGLAEKLRRRRAGSCVRAVCVCAHNCVGVGVLYAHYGLRERLYLNLLYFGVD